jgi:hypothetical protein
MIIFGKTKNDWKQYFLSKSDYIGLFVFGFILGAIIF